jgi:hypothetical protein
VPGGLVTGWTAAGTASGLVVLAMLDGAFSGFRSSLGRTGLIDHRAADRVAARRGAVLCCVLLLPVVAAVSVDAVLLHPARLGVYTWAGLAMLAVYLPYALIALTAIGCYLTMSWRKRYLASAVILGPFTLLRPAAAVAGGMLGVIASRDGVAAACTVAAVAAILAVEPAAGRIWYRNKELLAFRAQVKERARQVLPEAGELGLQRGGDGTAFRQTAFR